MPIYAKSSGGTQYAPAPSGTFAAVCVDVVDMGLVKVSWGGKEKSQHKITIVWQIDEERDDGKPHAVRKRYTLSLHEKAQLRKDLEAWRGRPFTDEELQGFDVETVIGVGAMVSIIHNQKDGSTYANVASVSRMPKGMQPPHPRDYVRICERAEAQVMPEPTADFGPDPTDDMVPF